MYARHYHQYTPSLATNIMTRFKAMGWVPPSEDSEILAKWKYYQECGWRKEEQNAQ